MYPSSLSSLLVTGQHPLGSSVVWLLLVNTRLVNNRVPLIQNPIEEEQADLACIITTWVTPEREAQSQKCVQLDLRFGISQDLRAGQVRLQWSSDKLSWPSGVLRPMFLAVRCCS